MFDLEYVWNFKVEGCSHTHLQEGEHSPFVTLHQSSRNLQMSQIIFGPLDQFVTLET